MPRHPYEDDIVDDMKRNLAASGGGAAAAAAASSHPPASNYPNTLPGVVTSHGAAAEANENIRRALRTSEQTHMTGYSTLQSLGKQRETIQNSIETVDSTHAQLGESRQVIREMRWEVYKEWIIKGCVIASLILLIILILYSKIKRAG